MAYVCKFNEETREYIKHRLNEDDDRRTESLEEIKTWMKSTPNLYACNDDMFILPFLRTCKFDLEATKKKILKFYKLRSDNPQWFANRDATNPTIRDLLRMGVFVPLETCDQRRLIVILRATIFDPAKYSIHDVIKAGLMVLDICAREYENSHIYGVTAIFDLTGVSFGHSKQLSIKTIRALAYLFENYHVVPNSMQFIYAPYYINVVLNVLRSFLSERVKKCIKVHFDNLDTLHQVIDKELLPIEYGGSTSTMEQLISKWLLNVTENRDWMIEDEKFKLIKM